tara:strand:+ start:263 stop:1183 length:921 start_codon:yes stop_codon:yes gene_type:complete
VKEKILILGGSGFIGSHLLRKLKDVGFKCYSISLKKNKNNFTNNQISYYSADLADISSLEKCIGDIKFDYLINLAGYIDHSNFFNGGMDVINSHYGSLLNILKTIDLKNIKKIIQIGSSDEYGNLPSPQNEAMREEPISPYAFGKLASTNLLQMLFKTENIPIVILRLFLVYGEGQSLNRFLPQIINGCLQNKKFSTTDGKQIKDFCYVSDIVEGILMAIKSDRVNGQIINLASGQPVSIRSIIEKVIDIIGYGNPQFGRIKYRPNENLSLYADISKAKKLMSWQPKIDLDYGLKKTIDYYSRNPK